MSDGPSIRYRRITMTCFRICSTCLSRSQAPLCHYTQRLIAKQPEGTIARLRYFFGGDRPSQTAHQAMSPTRFHGIGLELQQGKGGISTTALRELAPPLQSLPPILYMVHRVSISGYSKGARGLSVLMRVTSVFTGISTSPGLGR